MNESASQQLGRLFKELQLPQHEAAASLSTFQGKLWPTIVVEFSAFRSDDPSRIVYEVGEFVGLARGGALMLPGEFPEESLYSAIVEMYRLRVKSGGHTNVLADTEWTSWTAECVASGLELMGAEEHLAVFKEFVQLKTMRASKGTLAKLDKQFWKAENNNPLLQKNADWLRSLPTLQVVPDNGAALLGLNLRKANPLFAKRSRELVQPLWTAAWSIAWELCEKAGLVLMEFTSGHTPPEQVGKYGLGVQTTEGLGMVIFREHREIFWKAYDVVLHLENNAPIARCSMKLNRNAFTTAMSELSKRHWFAA